MPKILVLGQSAGLGGVESSLTNFLVYLTSKGCEVDLVLWRDNGPVRENLPQSVHLIDIQQGVRRKIYRTPGLKAAIQHGRLVNRFQETFFYLVRRALQLLPNPWILLNRIPTRYDVAIAYQHHGYAPYYLIDSVSASKKIMWYHHGSYSRRSSLRYRTDQRYFECMDDIVAVSQSCRDMLARHFPSIAGRLRVINNIVNYEGIRALSEVVVNDARPGSLTLVTVARLSPSKGIDLSIETAARLRDKGLDFVWYFVGDGPEKESLQNLIDAHDLNQSCILLGGRTNPYPYIRMADIYVQTTLLEAHPMTILEAMALARPIIATNIPAVDDLLSSGVYGVICPPTSDAFSKAIAELAQNSHLRLEYSARLAQRTLDSAVSRKEIDTVIGL